MIKQALAALAIAASLAVTAPANAAFSSGSNIQQDVRSAFTGSGKIGVTVNDGVATLFGYADGSDRAMAARAALAHPDVDRVINLVPQS